MSEHNPNDFYPIPEWECYGISKDAQIVRLRKNKGAVVGLILKQFIHKTRGYLTVRLCDKDRQKTFDVHRIMAITFLGDIPEKYEVCHNDGNKTNCKLENLRVDTKSSNQMDRALHGSSNRGENYGRNKYSEDLIRNIKLEIKKGIDIAQISNMFDMSSAYIRAIKNGHKWSWLEV